MGYEKKYVKEKIMSPQLVKVTLRVNAIMVKLLFSSQLVYIHCQK